VRRTVRSEPAPARPPKPTRADPAERFQSAVGPEHFDADAGRRIDIEDGLVPMAAIHTHAATPVGSASAKPRR
jgi:hypothetical protein